MTFWERHLAHLRLLEGIALLDGVGLASIQEEIREVEETIRIANIMKEAYSASIAAPPEPKMPEIDDKGGPQMELFWRES